MGLQYNSIKEFEKSAKRVSMQETSVKLGSYLCVREMYQKEGKWLPSKKGISLKGSMVKEIRDLAAKAQEVDPYPEEEVLATLDKNNTQKVKVLLKCYRGTEYMDIREYYEDKDSGEWKPSPTGITLPPDVLEDFIDGCDTYIDTYL